MNKKLGRKNFFTMGDEEDRVNYADINQALIFNAVVEFEPLYFDTKWKKYHSSKLYLLSLTN